MSKAPRLIDDFATNLIGYTPYDVAPDGRFLVNSLLESQVQPVTVVLNWPRLFAP